VVWELTIGVGTRKIIEVMNHERLLRLSTEGWKNEFASDCSRGATGIISGAEED